MWSVWSLTPRVFEQEARDKSWQDQLAAFELSTARYERHVAMCSTLECQASLHRPPLAPVQKEEKTLAHWDPDVYHSRLLWSCCCAAGVSFPAFHLLSWNAIFPSLLETWLWRISSIVSIVSMLGFMHFERIVLRWQDPLMVLKFSLPFLYPTLKKKTIHVGGPGGSGVDLVKDLAPAFRAILGDGFDLIGFDPRGIELSLSTLFLLMLELSRCRRDNAPS